MNAPLNTPPPLPLPDTYRHKVRGYTAARRSFVAKSARRRTIAVITTFALAAIVADIFTGLPEWARWLALSTLLLTAVGLGVFWWWRPIRALDEAAVTRELERGFPELGQRLRTVQEVESSPSARRVAPALAGALVNDTRRRMEALDPRTLIPWQSLRGPLFACVTALGTFAILLAVWPDFRIGAARLAMPGAGRSFTTVTLEDTPATFTDRENPHIVAHLSGRPATEATLFLREEGGAWTQARMARAGTQNRFDAVLSGHAASCDFYVTAGDGRSEHRHMRCLVAPKVEKAGADLQFPDYTGLAPLHSDGGDVRAVEGTTARVIFQLNHPMSTAEARLADGSALPVTVAGNQIVLEHTLARGEVVYRLSGRDADGLELAPANYKLIGLEDKIPEVELVEPTKDLEATTVWEILARVKAKDDFGLAEVGIILVVGDDIKIIAKREFAEKDHHEASEMGTALLEEFPLQITDNLKVYAYARDHKPRDGARAVSNLRAIDIRQFKVRWRLFKGQGMPMNGVQLRELTDLVAEQRKIVSDVFVLKENGVPSGDDLGATCDKIGGSEDKLAERVTKLKQDVEAAGTMARDDLVMLDTAAQQMGDASKHLAARLLRPAYRQADGALSSLLAMRKLIQKLLMQNQSPMPSDGEDQNKNKSLTELAAEAERLAGEEDEVRKKVSPEPPPEHELEVSRHQQEVAVTDAGELYAALVAHPESTELALQRMDAAEKSMQKADEVIRGAAPQDAGPELQTAEDTLLALAAQLRALDAKNLADTMGKLAEMATKAKQRMEQEKKDREGAKDQDKQGEPSAKQPGTSGEGAASDAKTAQKKDNSPKTAEGKDGAAKKDAGDPANAKTADQPAGGKDGKPAGPEKKPEPGQAESLGKVADQAATLDDVLQSLAKRAEGKDGERLAELREQAKTSVLAPDVKGLDAEKDDAKAGENAGDLAGRFGKIADTLSDEQRRLLQSRIAQLAAALAQTKEIEKNGGKAGEKPGDKPGEKGKGENEGKDGAAGKDAGQKPGGKDGKDGKNGKGEKGDKDGKGGNDPKSEQANRRGGGGDNAHSTRGGRGHYDPNATYLKDLERLNDDEVIQLTKSLAADDLQSGTFETSHLEAVEKRLGKMIDEMLRPTVPSHRGDRVPDEYSHLVDDYFRALSDDFGSEEWDTDEKKPVAK